MNDNDDIQMVVIAVTMSHDDLLKETTGSQKLLQQSVGWVGREVNKSQVDAAGICIFNRRRPGNGDKSYTKKKITAPAIILYNVLFLLWSSENKINLFLKILLLFIM